jgi:hypothetical protein
MDKKQELVDISRVGIPLAQANSTEDQFIKWCEKHEWGGDLKGAYLRICKDAKVKPKLSKKETKKG